MIFFTQADENIIQIMFMELKVQQLKLVGVANAKAVIVRIAESVHLAKTNLDSVVAEPKNKHAFIEFVLGKILLEKGLRHKLLIWQTHQRVCVFLYKKYIFDFSSRYIPTF